MTAPEPAEFVPIGVFGGAADEGPGAAGTAGAAIARRVSRRSGRRSRVRPWTQRPGVIEIDLADGVRLRVDAFVNERALRRVLGGVEGPARDPGGAGHQGLSGLPAGQHALRLRRPGGAGGARCCEADPFSGHLFLFRSKRADYLKMPVLGRAGLCLFAKRLESGKFVWPPIVDGGMMLTPAQLALLARGDRLAANGGCGVRQAGLCGLSRQPDLSRYLLWLAAGAFC